MVTRVDPIAVIDAILEKERLAVECCHHWIIEPAQGPTSMGECLKCNSVREFNNSILEPERED